MTANGQTLWSDGAYQLSVSESASDVWLQFVSHARFGAPGSSYRRHQFAREARQFSAPLFFTLACQATTVGSYLLDRRQLRRADLPVNGLYRGVLFIDPAHRGRGLARTVVEHALAWASARTAHPILTYGCVERRNTAARQVLGALQMESLGSLGSALKYSQRSGKPLPPPSVSEGISDALASVLAQTQSGDSLIDIAPADWLSTQRAASTAGCAAHLVSLNLDPASGLSGLITERALAYFPPSRKRFNPRNFRYVAIRQPVAAGAEGAQLFRELLSHLMHRYDTHFANVSLDEGDGSASANAVRQALGRRCMARRRIIDVLGSWHGDAINAGAPAAAMQLSAPDL